LDVTATIQAFREVIHLTPVLNRQLLLYLLDSLAVFDCHSDQNLMTTERLVAAFQPALLSRVPSAMSAEDHILAAEIMVFMTENQDHFLVT
jgi:RhoGAP domain